MFNRKFRSPLDFQIASEPKKYVDGQGEGGSKFSVGQGVFARNYGRGEKWLPGKIIEVKGLRNFVVKIYGKNGSYIWRRHSDQLKYRYNEDEDFYDGENESVQGPVELPIVACFSERLSADLNVPKTNGTPVLMPNLEMHNNSCSPPVSMNDKEVNEDVSVSAGSPVRVELAAGRKSAKVLPDVADSASGSSSPRVTRTGKTIKPPRRYGFEEV